MLNFHGKPLLAWTIEQALETPEIDDVFVTSDSREILDIAASSGAELIERPSEISGDTATSESAVRHALGEIGSDQELVLMLQPTSPLRKRRDLGNSVIAFRENAWDSGFAGAELDDFLIWRKSKGNELESMNYNWKDRGIRQDRMPDFVENGSIYLFRPKILLEEDNRMGGNIGIFLMEFWQSFEIDEPADWKLVQTLFQVYLGDEYGLD